MKIRTLAISATLLLLSAGSGFAGENVPAWQDPQFIMEEIVVFGQRSVEAAQTSESVELAWQAPGYVMEEVVATANSSQLNDARREMHRRMVTHRRAVASVLGLARW